jgi:hypothetical protein
MAPVRGGIMTAKRVKKATKVGKLKKVVANQAIADINALFKRQEKLDLELKKIQLNIKKLLAHQYFG